MFAKLHNSNRKLFLQKSNPFVRRLDCQLSRGLTTETSIEKARIETTVNLFHDATFDDCGGDDGFVGSDGYQTESEDSCGFSNSSLDEDNLPDLCRDEVDEDDIFNKEDAAQNEFDYFGVKELLSDSGNSEGKIFESKFPKIVIMVRIV
jgi:hypothetical protein